MALAWKFFPNCDSLFVEASVDGFVPAAFVKQQRPKDTARLVYFLKDRFHLMTNNGLVSAGRFRHTQLKTMCSACTNERCHTSPGPIPQIRRFRRNMIKRVSWIIRVGQNSWSTISI